MKRALTSIMTILFLLPLSGCGNKIVDSFELKVGENTITNTANFTSSFALDLTGRFAIDIQDVNYGEVFLNAASEDSPFQVGVTANFEAFTSDVWDGFGPAETLPNGDPLPGWVDSTALVEVDVPNFNDHFDLTFYIGYEPPYYLGVAVSLNFLDSHYPEGLTVAQNFKKESSIWGGVTVFGPTYDSEGSVLQHGGIFFLARFQQDVLEGGEDFITIQSDYTDLSFYDEAVDKRYEIRDVPKAIIRKYKKALDSFRER